jgi:acyl-CoA thioester hydrolase
MDHFTTQYYMAAFDQAAWHFLYEAGFDHSSLENDGVGWADVHQEIEYLKELRNGDVFYIESRPKRVGGKSLVYVMELKTIKDKVTCARLTATSVQFDLEKRKAIPVLPHVRQTLLAWLG